jgi:hypothetical protein
VVWDDTALYPEDAELLPTRGREAMHRAEWALGSESLWLEGDIFVSVEGLVDFWVYDWAPLGANHLPETEEPAHGVSSLAPIGSSGAESFINGTAIEDWRDRRPDWPQADEAERLATSWTRAWSGDTGEVDALYDRDARLVDTIAGIDLTGREGIAGLVGAGGRWQITTVGADDVRGVYPLVRVRSSTKALEELVLVVAGHGESGCDGEMLVWLTLDGGLVTEETRYWPIERARRCRPAGDLPDGWWTGLAVPEPTTTPESTEDIDTRTDPVVVGDLEIAVYNGTPALNRLVAWGLGRFEAAGLTPPAIDSVTFTRYSALCDDVQGLWVPTAEGSELTLCTDEGFVCWDDTCSHFTPGTQVLILHELAHAWMHLTLDERVEQRFRDHVGLDVWNDDSVPWEQRAVEHAADTIAWGLMDRELLLLRTTGRPSREDLAAGFRILTSTDPLPRTDEFSPQNGP